MACATLVPPQSKRRIDCVDGVDHLTGGSSKCKRSSGADFSLSPAAFGSPSRIGRLSPSYNRETGCGSPKSFLTINKPCSPSLPVFFSLATSSKNAPENSASTAQRTTLTVSPERELRYTAQQVLDMCKGETVELDTRLRQEYEEDLQNKLAEQYHSFVQYAQDHLQTNMQGPPPEMDMSYIG